jgi:hypothetical protein
MACAQRFAERRRTRGFALLLTVTLLSFIVLLLLALTVFVHVESFAAANETQRAQARQDALLGLTLALGQLQRYAGPDQRVTARATFLPAALANKTQWSGVWGDPTRSPVWLVSATAGAPTDPTTPLINPVVLVGANTADISNPASGDSDQVQAEMIDLTLPASTYPGWTGSADPVIGRYAYWVGEEASKPSLSVHDERSVITGGNGPNPSPQIDPGPLWGGYDFSNAANQASLARVLAYTQLGYVDSTAFSTTRMKQNYHRCTVTALGVPANPSSGGLKLDGSADAPNPYVGLGGSHFDATFFSANPPAGTSPDLLPTARFAVRHRAGVIPPASALSGSVAAANLLVAGAFNLNSIDPAAATQHDKWRAVLAAAVTLHYPGGVTRTLAAAELDALANQLTAANLQAASAVAPKNLSEPFRSVDGFARSNVLQNAIDAAGLNLGRTPLAPDYVRQNDLLALLAPILFVRSDTFVIRAYGEVRNPFSSATGGQAWCEAVVQRVADYVDPSDPAGASPSTPDNQAYGRRFLVVGFRWLTAVDL